MRVRDRAKELFNRIRSTSSRLEVNEAPAPEPNNTFAIRKGSLLAVNSLTGITGLQLDRTKKYAAMRRLMDNSTIRTTVDMYVDEICNSRGTGSAFKVTADSTIVLDSVVAFLKRSGFEGNLRKIALQLVVYGDVYLRTTHYNIPEDGLTSAGVRVVKVAPNDPEHFDISTYAILPPDCVFDVRGTDGLCKGFIVTNTELGAESTIYLMGQQIRQQIRTCIVTGKQIGRAHV